MSLSKVILVEIFFLFTLFSVSFAGISGVPCNICHGNPSIKTCTDCHAGGSSKIGYLGPVRVPKVLHSDSSGDLAGGNFAYITGLKNGKGDPNRRGHNVKELGVNFRDNVNSFFDPPGTVHNDYFTKDWRDYLTCAGYHGCHGNRKPGDPSFTGFYALWGQHHKNTSGPQTNPVDPKSSYRFLLGVKGWESSDWQNIDSNNHNEYFGSQYPLDIQNGSNCGACHDSSTNYIKPRNNTISGFCATCHGLFHDPLQVRLASPWLRHPTDVILPSVYPYNQYTLYSVETPVARTYVPSSPSSTVTPGQDVVMCLSCHYAHAGPYPSMLRWDYDLLDSPEKRGCKRCHNDK